MRVVKNGSVRAFPTAQADLFASFSLPERTQIRPACSEYPQEDEQKAGCRGKALEFCDVIAVFADRALFILRCLRGSLCRNYVSG